MSLSFLVSLFECPWHHAQMLRVSLDPDGYWIEVLQNEKEKKRANW